MSLAEDLRFREHLTPHELHALYREAMGWEELRVEVRQLIREELAVQLQAVFRSGLNKDGVTTVTS